MSFFSTIKSNYQILKNADHKTKGVTVFDFIMQVQPAWLLYLFYTFIRCVGLALDYRKKCPTERYMVWQKGQLYSSTKVSGLVVSQTVLTLLGLTTPISILIVLTWGCVLASVSRYAHIQSRKNVSN